MSYILKEPVTDASAWKGSELKNDNSWIYYLSATELDELDKALKNVQKKEIEVEDIKREDFPLPTFSKELNHIVEEIENGRGFVLIRGLEIDNYTDKEVMIIYMGISVHLGIPVSQSAYGELLGHIFDQGLDLHKGNARGYQTNDRLAFHTDSSDFVGLLCLNKAKSGGLSCIVSATTIFNAIVEQHPEYLSLLFSGFINDFKGEQPDGHLPYYRMPVFSYYDGKLSCRYVRDFIDKGPERLGLTLTNVEKEVLDVFDSYAHNEEFVLDMDFEPGDMQFLNNYTVLHSRTGFEDYPEPNRKRHLIRTWLTNRNGRKLSPEHSKTPGDHIITASGRGGRRKTRTRDDRPSYPVRK